MKNIIILLLLILMCPILSICLCEENNNNHMKRVDEYSDYNVQVDVSNQVIKMDIPEDRDYYGDPGASEFEGPVLPTLNDVMYTDFVSASIISAKAKQFDDGLYAAVELAVQNGTHNFTGKKTLLHKIYESLCKMEENELLLATRGYILSAAELGGQEILEDNQRVLDFTEIIKGDFLGNKLRSKPIGFYTWSDQFSQIFQQDRLLQINLTENYTLNSPEALAKALINSGEADTYIKYMELAACVNNGIIFIMSG